MSTEEKKNPKQQEQKSFLTRYAVWLLVPIILALFFSQHAIVLGKEKHPQQVLPENVVPTHYDLELTPDLGNFVYNGSVNINLNIKSQTSKIVLNANEIVINVAKVIFDDLSYTATEIVYMNKTSQVVLFFNKSFPSGSKVILKIIFQGTLNDQMSGFYRSSYRDANGNTKYLASTQFEATDARKAFPCWDEPSLKATFDITLNVHQDMAALSNTEVKSESPTAWLPNHKTVKYATTPQMSTYLVAFVIGPFEYIEKNTTGEYNGRPIRIRVYTLPGLSDQGKHALNVATQALEYYAQMFGVQYPMTKLDMVAIPDFDAGAMENWGLVTYRTTALLYDVGKSSFASKRQVAYVVCHELAHQWFGNLVTMKWWNHLWLNEGFATWVGWFAVDRIFPEWRTWAMFATQDLQDALNLDALRSSHPIDVSVLNPSEIRQIFDSISYLKGASAIRMITSWLGTTEFLNGVHRYLEAHRFGNADTEDLWSALSLEAGKNVTEVMDTWIQRPGYPVLNVSLIDSETIQISQSRYFSTVNDANENDNTVWWVPLRLKHYNAIENYILENKTQEFKIPANSALKLNHEQTALCRVMYSKELLEKLLEQLKLPGYGILSEPIDRAGLVSDISVLSQSGEYSTLTFLNLLEHLTSEKNLFVLSEISRRLNTVINVYGDIPSLNNKLQRLRRRIFAPIADKLGWRTYGTEPELYNLLRMLVIAEAGLSGQKSVVSSAIARYKQFMEQNRTDIITPDMLGVVYKIVLQNAKTKEEESKLWADIFNRMYNNESLPMDQRITALTAIGYTIKFDSVIQKNLDLILDLDQVRSQDAWMLFKSLAANHHARSHLVEYFIKNYDNIYHRFEKSMGSLGNAVNYMLSSLVNLDEIERLEKFFATKSTVEYSRSLNEGLERAKMNAAQLQRDKEHLILWSNNKEY